MAKINTESGVCTCMHIPSGEAGLKFSPRTHYLYKRYKEGKETYFLVFPNNYKSEYVKLSWDEFKDNFKSR